MTQTTLPLPRFATEGLLHYWPPLIGIAFAVNVSLHLPAGAGVAPVLAASAVVYVGAAAFGRRAAAWPVFGVTVTLITIGQLFDTAVGTDRCPADPGHRPRWRRVPPCRHHP
jgi:hypothetical protein